MLCQSHTRMIPIDIHMDNNLSSIPSRISNPFESQSTQPPLFTPTFIDPTHTHTSIDNASTKVTFDATLANNMNKKRKEEIIDLIYDNDGNSYIPMIDIIPQTPSITSSSESLESLPSLPSSSPYIIDECEYEYEYGARMLSVRINTNGNCKRKSNSNKSKNKTKSSKRKKKK
eukprot:220375_1